MSMTLSGVFISSRRSLMSSVLRIVRDRQVAEDLTQEAYLRAHRAIQAGPIEHLEAFLHRTVRNLAFDHERRRKTREKYERTDADPAEIEQVASQAPNALEILLEREREKALEAALLSLPERARQVWILSQLHGWSYKRIAEHMGVSLSTIYNEAKFVLGHCHDALARLDRP